MAALRLTVVASALLAAAAGPCDIYFNANTPCVAAHSTVRSLFDGYNGALYQVQRSDGAMFDIYPVSPGGAANSAAQDAFCGSQACYISQIYDQTPPTAQAGGNHLTVAPPGGAKPTGDKPCNATRHALTVGGQKVYGAYFEGGMGYRIDNTRGVATGNDPETLYMVTSGVPGTFNNGCCFDYGNAETDNHDDGAGTMEAIYWGNCNFWGAGTGQGPWVMADLENGLWAGNQKINGNYPSLTGMTFVTAMVKGGTNGFTLKAGDAQKASTLTTMYAGPRPNGYQPMKKQGSIILGIGGDNSDSTVGVFYEGLITKGFSTDAADDAVQADIMAAGYSL